MVSVLSTQPRVLDSLNCGMVPLREFPLRKWYYVSPLWYYHAPSNEHQLKLDRRFFELLDPELRELCAVALAAGLCTTPCCQGHFYPQSRFEIIWHCLNADAEKIRAGGLQLTDAETQEKCVFQQSDWQLPWADFESFHRETHAAQSHGYVGLAIPIDRPDLARRLHDDAFQCLAGYLEFDADLSERLNQPLFGIYVNAMTALEGATAWEAVTEYLKGVLKPVVQREDVASELPIANR